MVDLLLSNLLFTSSANCGFVQERNIEQVYNALTEEWPSHLQHVIDFSCQALQEIFAKKHRVFSMFIKQGPGEFELDRIGSITDPRLLNLDKSLTDGFNNYHQLFPFEDYNILSLHFNQILSFWMLSYGLHRALSRPSKAVSNVDAKRNQQTAYNIQETIFKFTQSFGTIPDLFNWFTIYTINTYRLRAIDHWKSMFENERNERIKGLDSTIQQMQQTQSKMESEIATSTRRCAELENSQRQKETDRKAKDDELNRLKQLATANKSEIAEQRRAIHEQLNHKLLIENQISQKTREVNNLKQEYDILKMEKQEERDIFSHDAQRHDDTRWAWEESLNKERQEKETMYRNLQEVMEFNAMSGGNVEGSQKDPHMLNCKKLEALARTLHRDAGLPIVAHQKGKGRSDYDSESVVSNLVALMFDFMSRKFSNMIKRIRETMGRPQEDPCEDVQRCYVAYLQTGGPAATQARHALLAVSDFYAEAKQAKFRHGPKCKETVGLQHEAHRGTELSQPCVCDLYLKVALMVINGFTILPKPNYPLDTTLYVLLESKGDHRVGGTTQYRQVWPPIRLPSSGEIVKGIADIKSDYGPKKPARSANSSTGTRANPLK